MTRKHHIRSSITTFVEKHTDLENHEKLKKTHKGMEEKKNRILSLMQNQQEIDVSKDELKRGTITELVEEFHQEYESLYIHYDTLTQELKKKVQHKEKFSSSDSSSDSDSDSDSEHSSKGKSLKNGKLENEICSATEATRQQLEAVTLEVADLKNRLATISNDKVALESDYMVLSSKLRDSYKIVEDLKLEAARLNEEKSELVKENEQLKQKLDTKVNEYMAGIEALTEQADKRTQETNTLQEERSRLESQMEEEKQEYSKRLSQLENENKELKTKVKTLTEDLSMHVESKEDIVAEFERTIDDLRRDLESAEDEANNAIEKTRTIEVQLRLANQKVRVTDQLLNEIEETHKIALEKHEEKCKLLEEKIAANDTAYHKMIINISKDTNKLLAGMESVAVKFEDDHEKFKNILTKMSEEIKILKHCTLKKNIEREQLKQEVTDLKEAMEEKISKLEERNEEKEELERALGELKKAMEELNVALTEKDELLTTLGEEKRQAIRQLCLWWDDAQSRYDHLKNVVSKAASERHQRR